MESKSIVVSKIRFDNPPYVIHGRTKHYATSKDGVDVVFYMKEPLEATEDEITIYFKPHTDESGKEIEQKDKFGNLQLKSASTTPHKERPSGGGYKGNNSYSRGNSYNQAQEKRLEYEKEVRDPRLTVQGLMSNYTQIAVAALNNGKNPTDAGKICDWVYNKAMEDAVKLQNEFKE